MKENIELREVALVSFPTWDQGNEDPGQFACEGRLRHAAKQAVNMKTRLV